MCRLRARRSLSLCQYGDGPFDRQIGFGTHSVCPCKFDGDCDGDGTCKWTLRRDRRLYSLNVRYIAEEVVDKAYELLDHYDMRQVVQVVGLKDVDAIFRDKR